MTDIDVNDDTIIGTPAQSLPIGGRMRYRIFVEPVQSLPASVVERVRSGQIVTASASGLAQNFYCDLLDIADRHLSPGASKALARVACGQAGHMDRQRLAGLGTVLNAKRDAHAFAAHFAPLLKEFGVSCRDYVDTGYVRVALPSDDMPRADAAVGSPIPSEISLDEQVACDIAQPPHRDLAVPHRHFEINFWFRLGPDGGRGLRFWPAMRQCQTSTALFPDARLLDSADVLETSLAGDDVLAFHSQHVHASPVDAGGGSRLTFELRAALGAQEPPEAGNRHRFRRLSELDAARIAARIRAVRGLGLPPAAVRLAPILSPPVCRHLGWSIEKGPLDASELADERCCGVAALGAVRLLARAGRPKHAQSLLCRLARTEDLPWRLEAAHLAADEGWNPTALALARCALELADETARGQDNAPSHLELSAAQRCAAARFLVENADQLLRAGLFTHHLFHIRQALGRLGAGRLWQIRSTVLWTPEGFVPDPAGVLRDPDAIRRYGLAAMAKVQTGRASPQ